MLKSVTFFHFSKQPLSTSHMAPFYQHTWGNSYLQFRTILLQVQQYNKWTSGTELLFCHLESEETQACRKPNQVCVSVNYFRSLPEHMGSFTITTTQVLAHCRSTDLQHDGAESLQNGAEMSHADQKWMSLPCTSSLQAMLWINALLFVGPCLWGHSAASGKKRH